MASPKTFLIETKDELQKVVWPSRQDVIRLTFLVIVASAAVGLYIGGLDYMFAKATELLIQQ